MNKQYLSVPVQYNTFETLQENDLKIPVSILVMHDQVNLNNSNFDFEVIDSDLVKESLKNIPILGYIKKIDGSDSKDFAGHEMEVIFKDGEISVTYLERPIGIIPETNNYEYVEKDGKKYVKVIGYLWKDYINDGYQILQDNPSKSVSMEIVVDAYEVKKDGIVDIKAYRYTGITILGDNVLPGMAGANMQVIGQFSEDQKFSKEFYERVEKLNFELNNNNTSLEGGETKNMTKEKEGENMDEKLELIAKYNFTLEQLNFDIEELSIEELEVKLQEFSVESDKPEVENISFSATYKQKRCAIDNALDPIIVKDEEGKIISETYYWLDDFSDAYCMVEKYVWDGNGREEEYGRFTYSFDETEIKATITSEFEKLIKTALTQAEYDQVMSDRNTFETMSIEFEELKTKTLEFEIIIATLTSEKDALFSENTKLQEFKSTIEFENKRIEIEGLVEDFEAVLKDNEEFEQIKKDVADDEKLIGMEVNVLEKELFALEGKVKHTKSNKTTKKPQVFSSKVSVVEESDINDSYYGEAVKYIKV